MIMVANIYQVFTGVLHIEHICHNSPMWLVLYFFPFCELEYLGTERVTNLPKIIGLLGRRTQAI